MKKNGFEVIVEAVSVLVAVLVIVWFILALIAGIKGLTKEIFFTESDTIIVENGDLLWNICKPYKPKDMDLREYIFEVCKYNNCTAEIYPGQKIVMLERKCENDC